MKANRLSSLIPHIELLEGREVPATFSMSGQWGFVTGTDAHEEFTITENVSNNSITVVVKDRVTMAPLGSHTFTNMNPAIDDWCRDVNVLCKGGNDSVVAMLSRFDLYAQGDDGNDTLGGGTLGDFLGGGIGDDSISGAEGNDTMSGHQGDDTLRGGWGNDQLWGHSGFDRLHGGGGRDDLYGGDDDDRLFGGLELDCLYGEGGNDWLDGGYDNGGWNSLSGGIGLDSIVKFNIGFWQSGPGGPVYTGTPKWELIHDSPGDFRSVEVRSTSFSMNPNDTRYLLESTWGIWQNGRFAGSYVDTLL